jgi:menaquinone-dependent protoporphyrinogen oxidase
MTHVLVAYATRHGSTRGIAERISDRLGSAGIGAEACPASAVKAVASYDAYVLGSAAYASHWLGPASEFVRRNRTLLAGRPVWLFSSGPLGTDTVDAKGRNVLTRSEPKEFEEFRAAISPRGTRVFFGAWDPTAKAVDWMDHLIRLSPAWNAVPAGDFRDWAAIDDWADSISADLQAAVPPTPAVTAEEQGPRRRSAAEGADR